MTLSKTMLCHYAECRILFIIMTIVFTLNVIELNVIMHNVILLNVVAPWLVVVINYTKIEEVTFNRQQV
jgi:hypothetical protein